MIIGNYPLLLTQVKQDLADFCIGLFPLFRGAIFGDMLNSETGTPTLARFFVQFCYPSPPMRFVYQSGKPHFFCLSNNQNTSNLKRLTHV